MDTSNYSNSESKTLNTELQIICEKETNLYGLTVEGLFATIDYTETAQERVSKKSFYFFEKSVKNK